MNLLQIGRGPRRVQRLTEIAVVLVRHGLSHLVLRLNLTRYLPRRKQLLSSADSAIDRETVARRLTLAMEDLGPTFVRLGQMLSSRPDLVGDEFVREFERLQDQVAPFPGDQARAIVEEELDRPVDELFAAFSDEPMACGSLAQVHRATLLDGTDVVVKIRRPDIERRIFTDLSLLRTLAGYVERYAPELEVFQPRLILDELERAMRRELDFVTEASTTARFHDTLAAMPGARCPKVFWDCTTSAVLTLERFAGVRITDREALAAQGVDRSRLARTLADVFLTQYLELGSFHGDPHPGNLMVLADGDIGLLDFGMVGRLTNDLRDKLGALLVAIGRREVDVVAEICFSLGVIGDEVNEPAFKVGVLELLDKYYGMPLKRIDPARVFGDVTALARECHMVLPRDFVLLAKSLVIVVGIAQSLDPDFDLAAHLRPRARELLRQRFAPAHLVKSLGLNLWSVGALVKALPRSLLRILQRAERNKLEFTFRHTGYEQAVSELDRAANRIAVSLILAAIFVGSSLLISSGRSPTVFGWISLGGLGYVVAGLLGTWAVWGILRSGRL